MFNALGPFFQREPGKNPHKYSQKLLEELPLMKESGETDLELVMPWNEKIQKTCSL